MSSALPSKLRKLLESLSKDELTQMAAHLAEDSGMVQHNLNNATGYQVDVKGGTVYIGNQYQIDADTLRESVQRLIQHRTDFTDSRSKHNRDRLINLVENFWISRWLKESLYSEVLLGLTLQVTTQELYSRLWNMVARRPQGIDQLLPPETSIEEVFTDMNKSLLILGEPGSGKTTTLVDLAQSALIRAVDNVNEPVPVIFNLASWTEHRWSIDIWIVNELHEKYGIPVEIAQPWVEHDELLLLLDGLDRVSLLYREDCVDAINRFLEQRWVHIVVCCRINDYNTLTVKVNLQGVIELQPLSIEQIQQFLASAGLEQSPLATDMQHSSSLQRLATSPLMLNFMAIAYTQKPDYVALNPANPSDKHYNHLFELYVERMLDLPTGMDCYPHRQTFLHWLTWLANNMVQQGEVEFLIEQLQPSCLSRCRNRRLYDKSVRVISGFLFLLAGMFAGILTDGITLLIPIKNMTFPAGLIAGISVGGLFMIPYWLAGVLARWLSRRLAITLTVGLTVLVALWLSARSGVQSPFILSMIIGLTMALPAAWSGSALGRNNRILLADRLSWSWEKARHGILLGVGAALIVGLIVHFAGYTERSFSDGITIALLIVPALALLTGLSQSMAVPKTTKPNQGIWQSWRTTLYLSASVFVAILLTGIAWGLICWQESLTKNLGVGLSFGLIFAFPIALVVGLAEGGIACLQHFILRLILYKQGSLPWNYSLFLDTAANCYLLRKAGGGYMFIHDLLLEYFANKVEEFN
jgi:hypothetical protein